MIFVGLELLMQVVSHVFAFQLLFWLCVTIYVAPLKR